VAAGQHTVRAHVPGTATAGSIKLQLQRVAWAVTVPSLLLHVAVVVATAWCCKTAWPWQLRGAVYTCWIETYDTTVMLSQQRLMPAQRPAQRL
jgi:hypothetical protein